MDTVTKEQLDKMMGKIAALIAKADNPAATPEEAATFREAADRLMAKWRIDEMMMSAAAPAGQGLTPDWADWLVCAYASEFSMEYRMIASAVAQHVGARIAFQGQNHMVDGEWGQWFMGIVVAYPSDLRYGEMLFKSAQLAFGNELEPRVDPSLGDQVNAYRLRKAGMEGRRIAMALWGSDEKNLRPKARKLFEKEARERGEDPSVLMGQGVNVKQWRKDYAQGFANELYYRLRMSKVESPKGTEVVLAGRAEAITEAYYERFPNLRPKPVSGSIGEGSIFDDQKNCKRCQAARSGYCREHQWMKPSTAYIKDKTNYAARGAGARAAQTVDLGQTGRIGS